MQLVALSWEEGRELKLPQAEKGTENEASHFMSKGCN